jgi:hypothetical protein
MSSAIGLMVSHHRDWLDKNGSLILERDAQYLREDLADGSPQAFQQIPDSLDALATYYGIRGVLDVIDGKSDGWKMISTAIDFRGWGVKIRSESFFRQSSLGVTAVNLTNYISRAACLACVSEKWCEMAEATLRRIDSNPDSADQGYWQFRRFEPFVIACCDIRNGSSAYDITEWIGDPYRDVLLAWNDESKLAGALNAVCDYHCQNMDDTGGDWDPEFKHAPFDLLACEIMLVTRVRERLGLSMPAVDHPLVKTLKIESVFIPSCDDHELLRQLATAFSRCYA